MQFSKIASMTFLEIENLSKIVYDVFPLHMDISDKFSDLLLLWILLITIRSDATLPKDCFGDVLRDRKIWTISSSDDMSLICNIHYAVDPVKCVHWREIDLNLPRTFDPKTSAWKWTYKVCYEHITGKSYISKLILCQIFLIKIIIDAIFKQLFRWSS